METAYTIGKLAEAVGVPTSTVRYYERRGLLQPNDRNQGNYRIYGDDAIERLRFIRAAQATGFTLDDVATLLALRVPPKKSCKDVQQLMENRLEDVKQKMAEMRHVERVLKGFLKKCQQTSRAGHCQLIGVQPDGVQYPLLANTYIPSELAGICFSPDGRTMFVNIQKRGLTLAIRGPWPS